MMDENYYNNLLLSSIKDPSIPSVERIASVELALRNGANINVRDNYGATPLLLTCSAGTQNKEIFELLLRFGPDVNAMAYKNPATALLKCVDTFSPDPVIIKRLIEAGADVNHKDALGRTPLILVALFCFDENLGKEVVRLLLDAGADIYAKDSGRTALDAAKGKNECIYQLLKEAKEKDKCIALIRKNARVLSLVQGPKEEASLISTLPSEVLAKIAAKSADDYQCFNESTKYNIACNFFQRPRKDNIKEEQKYISAIKHSR